MFVADEAPDGTLRELCKGWMRASHRKIDPKKSKLWQPYHPHTETEPLTPGEVYELPIEIWPTCNLFKTGHRLRIEIANCDSVAAALGRPHTTLRIKAKNTVHEGGKNASRLIVPVIPR